MSSSRLIPAIQLLRPFNVLVMMLVIAAVVILASGDRPDVGVVLLAALVGGLIGGAANTINDYYDIEIDRINKPQRPLARSAISPEWAFLQWLLLSLVGISLNLFLPFLAFWIAAGAVVVLFLYSARLKKTLLWGNLTVAVMTAMALVYGAVVAGDPGQSVVPALFAFLINFGREVVKDVEDLPGDLGGNARTFPARFGVKKSLLLATAILLLLLAATFIVYGQGMYGRLYLILVSVVDAAVLYSIVAMWKDPSPPNLGRVSLVLKLSMVVGLAAIYLGSE
jgi:geranylgeranylglycerol-phosphate geranylgeranyltransferase